MILIATCNVEMKTSEQDIKQQFSQKYMVINLYILEWFLTPFYIEVSFFLYTPVCKYIEIRIY